jgi:outer membrane protein W
MKKIITLSIALLALASTSYISAQNKGFVSFGWKTGMTLSDTKDYADEFSLEGFHFGAERFVGNNFTLGVDLSFQHFYEEAGKITYKSGNSSYTGSGYKYFDAAPITLSGKYYFGISKPNASFVPYMGFGAGAYYIKERLEVGSVAFEDTGWAFGITPQVGFMIRLDRRLWFYSDFAYSNIFGRKDINDHSLASGTLGLKIGF